MGKKITIKKENQRKDTPADQKTKQKDTLEAMCAEYIEMARRARADYENLKNETEQWKQNFTKFATENFIEDFLPILDNFTTAMSHIPQDKKKLDWIVGIEYIKKQFEEILRRNNVKLFGATGDIFDPSRHEAVDEKKVAKVNSGTVMKVVRPGCQMGDRIVRPAQVVVAK